MKAFVIISILMAGFSAHALDYQTVQLVDVYGTGWEAAGGWLVPMSESSADAILALEAAKKTKATCSVKYVTKGATTDPNTLEFLAYDIQSCQ